jgi:hypothetical protein
VDGWYRVPPARHFTAEDAEFAEERQFTTEITENTEKSNRMRSSSALSKASLRVLCDLRGETPSAFAEFASSGCFAACNDVRHRRPTTHP